jgi:hypothetical protein
MWFMSDIIRLIRVGECDKHWMVAFKKHCMYVSMFVGMCVL